MSRMSLIDALNLGKGHQMAGRREEAERVYREIVAQLPQCAEAWHWLGVLFCDAGRVSEGIELIRRSIALDPAPVFRSNLGVMLWRAGQLDEAAACLRQVAAGGSGFTAVEPDQNLAAVLKCQG